MKILVTAAALLFAGAAQAQTPPTAVPAPQAAPAPSGSLTRDLNSGPPAPAVYLAPAPAPVIAPTPVPAPSMAPPAPATPTPATPRPAAIAAPAAVPPAPVYPTPVRPRVTPAPTVQPSAPAAAPPVTVQPAPRPSAAPAASPAPAPPPAPAPVVAAPAPAPAPVPAAPAVTVLDSAARAALPFTADLPPGFEIVTGRPGPDFRIYTIRRGDQSFVMVYAGPASQFPIYSGQMVEAAGRASILSTEDGIRHAVEHLFQRTAAPREVHVWTMSLDGADRDVAEQIAQSVDVR